MLCRLPLRRRTGASQGPIGEVVMTARTWTWIAGAAVVACVAILLTDYVLATWQAPRDDKILKNLQQQVKSDAALAAKLAAEQKRITATRRARKSRDNAAAWILIAAAAVFLGFAKHVVQTARPGIKIVGQAHWPARDSQSRSLVGEGFSLPPTPEPTLTHGLGAPAGRHPTS